MCLPAIAGEAESKVVERRRGGLQTTDSIMPQPDSKASVRCEATGGALSDMLGKGVRERPANAFAWRTAKKVSA